VSLPPRLRWSLIWLLGAVALIELLTAIIIVIVGPFATRIGPVSVTGGSVSKALATAVISGSGALWLLEPLLTTARRARLETISSLAAYVAVVIGMVPLLLPYFLPDFLWGHDGGVHQTYSYLFDRALQQGQFPVRWVEGLGYGRAQPLFNFYQVGFYYLVELIHHAGLPLSTSVKVSIATIWSGGALLCYVWLRPFGRLPALLAAAVFAWSPYVLLDGYVRTAYPELMAMCLIPALFWSLDRLLRTGEARFVCLLALSIGLLITSHLAVSVITAPVGAAYVLVAAAVNRDRLRRVSLVAVGVVVGVGLAAFFAIPSILEQDAVRIRIMTSGYEDFRMHFLRPAAWFNWSWGYGAAASGAADEMSTQIGIVQWMVVLTAVVAAVLLAWRRDSRGLALAGWLAVFAFALFMMTAASVGIWIRLPPLAFLQFPWRFLVLPTIACSALAAILLALMHNRTTQALIVICAVALQWTVTRNYRALAWDRNRAVIRIDEPAWAFSHNATEWGFRHPGFDPKGVEATPPAAPERWTSIGTPENVTPLALTDTHLSFRVDTKEPLDFIVRSPFFPGWQVSLDQRAVSPRILPETAYMAVAVPAGSHHVEATFGNTTVRAAANAVSAVSIVVWLALLAWSFARMKPGDRVV
jgi:hypothetical protein